MKVERVPTSDEWKRTVSQNLAIGRAQREWQRRHHARFPLRNRWWIVRARTRRTWRQVWLDLVYLVRG